jgi:3-methylcrotonyl-CoA carboxylase alpha subunit
VADQQIRVGDNVVTVDPSRFSIERTADGTYLVSDGARRWRVIVAGPAEDRWVFVNGRVARVEVMRPGRTRNPGRARAHDMAAPMPATVVKILVQAGDRVEKGAPVVMLEAMKMELAVRAAQSGTVRSVNCKPGELVQPGVQLVEIEE